ncbi:protein of unknown function [Pseudodesulfovibrio profundus]|uniref:Teneurin-like YD-shell domain-containing protein n=2 Tax=Pseudodesulfovibrio profundus TaxID=57320 RepID=A0A2C8FCE7_9BACT|nr:protein of unknown function [Pseudodesulfovibrio profundus]
MLFSTPAKDRYCKFTYNSMTGEYERDWIEYADGTFEPVRRNGHLRKKWNGQRTNCQWWHTRKPADWLPWEHGHGFAWNHTLGHDGKPADRGDNSQAEIKAGNAPYFMEVETDADSRIESRTERIDGRRESWDFAYDQDGRLTSVVTDIDWAQDYEYDDQGRRKADHDSMRDVLTRTFEYGDDNRLLSAGTVHYEHDQNGFRCTKIDGDSVTRYQYSDDYRLLGALLPDGHAIAYEHDENGQRSMKYVDGQPTEAYLWRDFISLGAFFDGEREYVFNYEEGERLPYSMTVNGSDYILEYDQVGTLKAVVSPTGNVV